MKMNVLDFSGCKDEIFLTALEKGLEGRHLEVGDYRFIIVSPTEIHCKKTLHSEGEEELIRYFNLNTATVTTSLREGNGESSLVSIVSVKKTPEVIVGTNEALYEEFSKISICIREAQQASSKANCNPRGPA